ncbi:hypothetical protein L7F22_064583 [Adiantum nelumboides]|nr:hypothetical protein [Adiantum nelumboides]
MASLGGESSGWVEKFCRLSDMVIARRIVILHHALYGFFECYGEPIECDSSMLYMVHRKGNIPPYFTSESGPLFRRLGMQSFDSVMRHYLPDAHLAMSPSREAWRGGLQRSESFLSCFLEMLCRRGGVCLEFGCGTAPILTSCLATSRACVSLDVDERLIMSCVEPLIRQSRRTREEATTSMNIDDEVKQGTGLNPFDD